MELCASCLRLFLLFVCSATLCHTWNTEDFSLFDLVEEIGVGNTFYNLLDVKQDASISEIKRAYRKLSLVYHPDKNKAEDAADKFRQLAAIYEVLKSEELRQRYNDVLEFGLPDWRQPIFYYRNLRRMPLWETVVILILIVSIAQYLMMWGAYWERKMTVLSQLRRQEKKLKQKNKGNKGVDIDEVIDQMAEQTVEKPSWKSLLPFWTVRMIIGSPGYLYQRHKEEQMRKEEERLAAIQEEEAEAKRNQPRERVYIEKFDYELAKDNKPVSTTVKTTSSVSSTKTTVIKTGPWTLDELNYLVRLSTSKYPVGTPSRWEKIAEAVQRKPDAVTQMIGKLKHIEPSDYHKLCHMSTSKEAPNVNPEHNNPSVATPDTRSIAVTEWTQNEQKQLEAALIQFPKTVEDRWDKISDCIPGRDKDECMQRYKYLASILRQRKAAKAQT